MINIRLRRAVSSGRKRERSLYLPAMFYSLSWEYLYKPIFFIWFYILETW